MLGLLGMYRVVGLGIGRTCFQMLGGSCWACWAVKAIVFWARW